MIARRIRHYLSLVSLLLLVTAPTGALATPNTCVGDCDGSGDVTVDEIITMVNIALGGATVDKCPAGDSDGSGTITVDEIITAVTNALNGCGTAPTATAGPADTPTAVDTETPTETPTAASTETEIVEPTETETPEPTNTNGLPPATETPAETETPEVSPTDTPEPEPTDTPEPEPTDTPEAEPTDTAIIIPTDTPVAVPTDTPGNGTNTTIDVGSNSGPAGSTVGITVSLSGGNDLLTATGNDIVYDTTQVRVALDGVEPDCTINAAIGAGTTPNKMLLLSRMDLGGGMERLRVGVISFSNSNSIPDGELFRCNFQIDAAATTGAKILANTPSASDALGGEPPVGGSDGVINVEAAGGLITVE